MLAQMHWREEVPPELWDAPHIDAWKIEDTYGQMEVRQVQVVKDATGHIAYEWPMGRKHILLVGPLATLYFDYPAALAYAAETCELRASSYTRKAEEFRRFLAEME